MPTSASEKLPRLLTVRELSQTLGVPKWRIYELLAQGKGPPHLRIGRTYRVAEDAVALWIQEQQSITTHEEEHV